MYKIRDIKFQNHPVLRNLELNFCDHVGNAVDTIILAGENGIGKSTVLNVLYKVATYKVDFPLYIEFEDDNKQIYFLSYYIKENGPNKGSIYVNDGKGIDTYIGNSRFKLKYPFNGIFSDVAINFHANEVSKVTSLTLDKEENGERSTDELPTKINQLLVDIQDMDDSELARAVRRAEKDGKSEFDVKEERMTRFTNAFDFMFDNLSYDHVENKDGKKAIIFKKDNEKFTISDLSSGEKQIVYRGAFLLKDINAMNGSFVFIDEPEVSLHPKWQMKIMEFYKRIFTNQDGIQTSQIFAVTHSPFVIHNNNRSNDKVIVLERDNKGYIICKDKPVYYKCNSEELVQDAFSVTDFIEEQPIVFLEGETDELYFKKALEVYGYKPNFQFRWVGYIGKNGQVDHTGVSGLNDAVKFLRSRKFSYKNVCLYDSDAKKERINEDNVIIYCMPMYDNSKGIKAGIENALVLDNIDIEQFQNYKVSKDSYGMEKEIPNFQKKNVVNISVI